MPDPCLVGFFEKYQTFLVGVLGFGGVIVTLFINARQIRSQHERQVKHEQGTTRTAIYSELKVIKEILADRCRMDEEKEGFGAAYYPKNISTIIFQEHVSRLGLLTSKEIEFIVEAYALVSDLPLRLGLLSSDPDPSFSREGYLYIESMHAKTAIGMHKSFLIKIDRALEEMEKH